MSDEEYPQLQSYTAPQDILDEHAELADEDETPDAFQDKARSKQVAARQSDYHLRRFNRTDGQGEGEDESYEERMRRINLEKEEEKVRRYKEKMEKEEKERGEMQVDDKTPPRELTGGDTPPRKALVGDETPPRAQAGDVTPPARSEDGILSLKLSKKSRKRSRRRSRKKNPENVVLDGIRLRLKHRPRKSVPDGIKLLRRLHLPVSSLLPPISPNHPVSSWSKTSDTGA